MTNHPMRLSLVLAALGCVSAAHAQELITNGGFESGFSGWSRAQQLGSGGSFLDQTGATSPVNAFPVQPPPLGLHAAMTDADSPGAHVLYQDFIIPVSVPQATLRFSLFINNTATAFATPNTLDWASPVLNQQARVDIITTTADPFSVGAADILQSLFQTTVGSPLVTGYNVLTFDVTPLLAARPGQTLRLRFAETDNVNAFNFGVDGVSLAVPAPAGVLLAFPLLLLRTRTRR